MDLCISYSHIGRGILVWAVAAVFALLCACTKAAPAEMLSHADAAIIRGDTAYALHCCQSLEDASLTSSQLCHRALLYAKIAQSGNNAEHMASAASSLKQALTIDTDSAAEYIAALPFTDKATISEVYSLCACPSDSLAIDDEEPCDSEASETDQ